MAQSGRDLISRIKALGFDNIELGSLIAPETLVELAGALEAGEARPVSVRNYFSRPVMAPDGAEAWSLSAPEPAERRTAVDLTRRAIALAARLGAGVVVVDLGRLGMDPRKAELRQFYRGGRMGSAAARRLVGDLRAERAEKVGPALERVKPCLETLIDDAGRSGVKLGLKSACYMDEMSHSDDLSEIFETFPTPVLGYWHDVGAAFIQEELTLGSQMSYLGRHRSAMIGIYVHDSRDLRGGMVPGAGDVDFSYIGDNSPGELVCVLAVRPGSSRGQLQAGAARLREAGVA